MTANDSRARQLEIVIGAVEDGMLNSLTALRAVSQWLSSANEYLCDVLLVQPELTDASKQSIRARFAEVELEGNNTAPVEGNDRTIHESGIRRLRVFLEEPEEVPDAAATEDAADAHASSGEQADGKSIDFSLAADGEPKGEATEPYVPAAKTSDNRARLNFVSENFQVLREFARGGLGILYLAQDKRLQRPVILKKIRPEYARSSLAREKFVLEAEVTGQLEHPGIVPIYALDTDGQREPYYAMRLIGGKNLHAAIAEFHAEQSASDRFFDGLRFRDLLQRFVDVCHALHYAHSRGVIHRDLKPANIMLGDHGETLVIDWGLAKSLSSSMPAASVGPAEQPAISMPIALSGERSPTIEGDFAGTARYAPPEQLAGQLLQLCPGSDVYSLGAILVEILCNQPALEGTIENHQHALAKISAGLVREPRAIMPLVPRSLNAICVKAMSINIADRYASAEELGEDVQRWLADECVLAYRHQETRFEKVGRWFRHHRSWAAGIAFSFIALTVSALAANYFINQARLNEKTAKRQALEFKEDAVARYRVAKSAVDTLMERSDKLLDIAGTEAIRAQLLQEASSKYAQLSQTQSLDPDLEIERARAIVRLADALALQGQSQAAFEQYGQVIRMLTPEASQSDTSEAYSIDELRRRIELGRTFTRRAVAQAHEQKFDLAREDFNRAIEMLKELQTRHSDSDQLAGNLATAQLSLGVLEAEQGRDAVALSLAQDSLHQHQSQDLTNDRLFAVNLVQTHQLLERLNRQRGNREVALGHLNQADEILSHMFAQDSKDPRVDELRADLWVSAATHTRHQGDFLGATAALEKALTVYERLNQMWPGSTNYALNAAITHLDLALVYEDLREYSTGQPHLDSAWQQFLALRDSVPENQLSPHLASTLDAKGCYLMASEDVAQQAESVSQFQTALELLLPLVELARDSLDNRLHLAKVYARLQSHQAQAFALSKQAAEAKANYVRAVDSLEFVLSNSPSNDSKRQLAHTVWHQASLEFEQEQIELATSHLKRALELWREVVAADPTPLHQYELGRFYAACPVTELRNQRLALQLAQGCTKAIPDNPIFAKLLDAATSPIREQ